jgi:di/tricarboxylate transporter
MTAEIVTTLAILSVAVIPFMTEWIRVDVVALLVLASLALTGFVDRAEALSGFGSLAVITVWAVLILSSGLARTAVAGMVGRQVLRLAGGSEARSVAARPVAVIMLTVGVLSGFMNDIGVAALTLPKPTAIASPIISRWACR